MKVGGPELLALPTAIHVCRKCLVFLVSRIVRLGEISAARPYEIALELQ